MHAPPKRSARLVLSRVAPVAILAAILERGKVRIVLVDDTIRVGALVLGVVLVWWSRGLSPVAVFHVVTVALVAVDVARVQTVA